MRKCKSCGETIYIRNSYCNKCRGKIYRARQKQKYNRVAEWRCGVCGYRHNLHEFDKICHWCGSAKGV